MGARSRLASLMDATVNNARNWHYILSRPFSTTITAADAEHGRVWLDCSAGFITLCRLAGVADDPGGYGYHTGVGNSGSIWSHLPHITLGGLDIGDAVIFGPGGDHHVSMVREPGPDPLLWSNGSEAAPVFFRLSQEASWQPHPVTFARIAAPRSVPPKPPVDPYWAWLRWQLGEGEFKGHKLEPALRPKDAPARIPDGWWRRRKRFLSRRSKPPHGTSVSP